MLHDQITLMFSIGRQHLNPIFDQRFDHRIAAGSQAEFRAGIEPRSPVYPSQFSLPRRPNLFHFTKAQQGCAASAGIKPPTLIITIKTLSFRIITIASIKD